MPAAAAFTTSVALAALAAGLGGCVGSTVGSGVGETRLERAPYYAGRAAAGVGGVAYLPVLYQPGAAQPPIFDPEAGQGTPVAALLAEMNRYLDSLAAGGASPLPGPIAPPPGSPPDVQFGCDLDASDECVLDDEGGVYRPGRARMRLAVARPSSPWADGAAAAMDGAGAGALLVLTLEVGHYWPRQTSWRGSKAVELGTDRTVALPWLTSLETPLSVLQLTGALVGRDGRAIRIGAEGLRARRTPIVAAGFGAQALITEEDVAALMTERADDGADGGADGPLVWQAALRSLLVELAGWAPRSE